MLGLGELAIRRGSVFLGTERYLTMKTSLLRVVLLLLIVFVLTVLESGVGLSTPREEYGLPWFLRLEFGSLDGGRLLVGSQFRPFILGLYLAVAATSGFFLGRGSVQRQTSEKSQS
jgi:hypothetical protein